MTNDEIDEWFDRQWKEIIDEVGLEASDFANYDELYARDAMQAGRVA